MSDKKFAGFKKRKPHSTKPKPSQLVLDSRSNATGRSFSSEQSSKVISPSVESAAKYPITKQSVAGGLVWSEEDFDERPLPEEQDSGAPMPTEQWYEKSTQTDAYFASDVSSSDESFMRQEYETPGVLSDSEMNKFAWIDGIDVPALDSRYRVRFNNYLVNLVSAYHARRRVNDIRYTYRHARRLPLAARHSRSITNHTEITQEI